MGTPAARELDYAERKINQNFSNSSAWHSRTALLPALYGAEGEHAGAGVLNRPTAAAAPAVVAAAADAEVSVAVGEAGEDALVGALRSAALGGTDDSVAAAAEAACSSSGRLGGTAAATAAVVVPQAALDAEYELVKQAFYTEPEDQSGWFYHRWLLGGSMQTPLLPAPWQHDGSMSPAWHHHRCGCRCCPLPWCRLLASALGASARHGGRG